MFSLYDCQDARFFKTELYLKNKKSGVVLPAYSAALPENNDLKIRFFISRKLGTSDPCAKVVSDIDGHSYFFDCTWTGIDGGFDVYESIINFNGIGLYFLTCSFKNSFGIFSFKFPDETFELPITVYDEGYTTPDWFKGSVMYQIFVDRFAKSEKHSLPIKPGAIINNDWENGIPPFPEIPGDHLDNNVFFGGSLYGVIEKLDYLKSLGVNTLYLNPIFEATSNHKYDTSDYFKIDSMFGGEMAFCELIEELKKRDMHLILDGVFNHTGDDSIYFNKYGKYNEKGAYQGKNSPYYEWYDFINYPDDYQSWWGIKILPSIKKNCSSFRNFICGENGVIKHYIDKGIDGWRLDVVDELSDEFLNDLRATARAKNKNSLIIGEVWEDAAVKIAYDKRRSYFQGSQLDSVMNYPLRSAIIEYLLGTSAEVLAKNAVSLYLHYPKCVSDVQMNILGTHDTERILNVLSNDGSKNMTNRQLSTHKIPNDLRSEGLERLKIASFLLYTLPGVPCIYYGDEIGMEGGRDPFNRMPFSYKRKDDTILKWYRLLGKMRSEFSDFKDGIFSIYASDGGLFVFRRGNIFCATNTGNLSFISSKNIFTDYFSGKTAELSENGMYILPIEHNSVGLYVKK